MMKRIVGEIFKYTKAAEIKEMHLFLYALWMV